ncbi:rhodanese-like domain-containing protein [Winogradskyella ursingii]|uniref:rhodanese-like domain-containing protein n=1 Tax=Winogradskyella ursingii TaxID=2686079 RepID=UPI0015CA5058|nr:rhodanese-like domain-containing protein [Winogradskyella ursingii]
MRLLIILLLFLFVDIGHAQNSINELLKTYNSESIPYMSVQELAMPKTDAVILDAREIEEFNVSHIKDAFYVGYNNFNVETIKTTVPDTTTTIVVYCSVGIRSENIGEQLKKAGYTNVYNLFGGIFEWKNNDFPIYNPEQKETESVHAYSKAWSKWLLKGTKVYD